MAFNIFYLKLQFTIKTKINKNLRSKQVYGNSPILPKHSEISAGIKMDLKLTTVI